MSSSRCEVRLPPLLVALIQRRLALRSKGGELAALHSIRAICRENRVNRDTVRAIDRNHYQVALPCFKRCGGCGHDAVGPCHGCLARAAQAACN